MLRKRAVQRVNSRDVHHEIIHQLSQIVSRTIQKKIKLIFRKFYQICLCVQGIHLEIFVNFRKQYSSDSKMFSINK